MASTEVQDKRLMTESLTKLEKFAMNPRGKQACDEARVALGELGNAVGRLLANRPQEDIAFTSSLTELDGFVESLRYSPEGVEAKRRFDVSPGDTEYRVKRLFGVAVR